MTCNVFGGSAETSAPSATDVAGLQAMDRHWYLKPASTVAQRPCAARAFGTSGEA